MSSECGTAGLEPVLAAGLNTLIPKLYREFIEQNCRQAPYARTLLVISYSSVKVSYLIVCIVPDVTALQKGGVPAAPSGTATLLRLSPNYQFCPRTLLAVTYFRHPRLSWLDGRCVQGPGTYSPRHG